MRISGPQGAYDEPSTEFVDIPEFPVERSLFDKLKARIQLAKQIDTAQHRVKKEKHERNWMRGAADAMEVELDSDFML